MHFFAAFARLLCCLRARAGGAAFALALLLLAPAAQAQRAPFSEVSLYAGGNATVGLGALDPFYRASPGVEAGFSTPFYAGVAGLRAGLLRLGARPGQAGENLWAAPVALHWGVRPALGSGRLRGHAALRLGTLLMRFSGGGPGLKNESELLMGAEAGLSLRVAERWRLTAGVRYEHVFTSTAFPLWQVRAGVRRRFDAPRWFQTLLR